MKITVTVDKCLECPHARYSPEGSYCTLLLQDGKHEEYFMPEGAFRVVERCPLKRSSL